MTHPIDFQQLQDFFAPDDIEWKPITVSKKTGKGLAAPYVTNRAIMDRLDAVCGPENWHNTYQAGPDGGVLCGLSIRVGDDWVTKWDGAENTDIEAVKGGLSSSMRRAAVQWGIGRYLYRIPMQWVPVDDRGRFSRPPSLPSAFLPSSAPAQRAPQPAAEAPATEAPAAAQGDGASSQVAEPQPRLRPTGKAPRTRSGSSTRSQRPGTRGGDASAEDFLPF